MQTCAKLMARETGIVMLAAVCVFCNVRLLMHHLLIRELQSSLHITCKCVSEVAKMYVLIKQQALAQSCVAWFLLCLFFLPPSLNESEPSSVSEVTDCKREQVFVYFCFFGYLSS